MVNSNAIKWAEALESGEFNQAKSQLRDSNGYCCLGVACEVFRRETGKGVWIESVRVFKLKLLCGEGELVQSRRWTFMLDGEVFVGGLPPEVTSWLGLKTKNGQFMTDNENTWLTEINDSTDLGFKHIAKLIRNEPTLYST